MRLREIKRDCPDRFSYRGKDFIMTYYGMSATHGRGITGKRSDFIFWESQDKKTCVTYDKGYIYAENEKGEVFAEVE